MGSGHNIAHLFCFCKRKGHFVKILRACVRSRLPNGAPEAETDGKAGAKRGGWGGWGSINKKITCINAKTAVRQWGKYEIRVG